MLPSVAGPVRKKSSDHHLSTVRPVRLVVQLVGQRSFLSSDPVNNCTWYFEPDMGITMMQEPGDQAMDRETQSGFDPANVQGQTTIEEASLEYDLTSS